MFSNAVRRVSGMAPSDASAVRLEASSICQLRCPCCPTGRRETKDGAIGWGQLSIERFANFLDRHPQIRRLELSNYGEVFLNNDLEAILARARARGVEVSFDNGVNLNTAKDSALEAAVLFGVREITVSVDGASNETYVIYRKGGNFDNVIANVKRLNHYKEKHHSEIPKLTWQFVIFGHNEHELPLARKMAAELGMSFKPKLSWSPGYSPMRDLKMISREIGKPVSGRWRRAIARIRDNGNTGFCAQLWESPQINWDGGLLGCCVNSTRTFGNVFEQGLEVAMQNPDYLRMKRVVSGKELPTPDLPCYKCSAWRQNLKYRYAVRVFVMTMAERVRGLFRKS